MKKFVFLLSTCVFPGLAAVNVPITVQETIYPGSISGMSRTSEPVTVGIPLPDDPTNGATDVSQLSLTGASIGQFRVLGRWPSGRIKWVLVDTQASVPAGGTNASIVLTGGAGNFGGANLASDSNASAPNQGTITISTGAVTFTIRKANFNVIDQASAGGKILISSGTSQGMVVLGPDPSAAYPGNVTCLPTAGGSACATVYSSANDATSQAVIEENGPARVVVKATGYHRDAAGHPYMAFTVRLTFYAGKGYVKVASVLRNADYGASNTLASATKGYQGYELRLTPNLAGNLNYSIATHTNSPTAGTLTASDSVYLYQAESTLMKASTWCSQGDVDGCIPPSSLAGYSIVKNGGAVLTGTGSQYPQGWADISDSSGAGLEVGQYQFAAYGNKSLEFMNGGRDLRVGIWASENNKTSTAATSPSVPYYQAWPQWSVHPDIYLNFHAAADPTPANDFLKLQHFLVARASSVNTYNAAGVFPVTAKLIDGATEDQFYTATVNSASPTIATGRGCCIQDYGTTDTFKYPLNMWRFWIWNLGGGSTQTEFRWSQMLNFLERGWSGRYLDAAAFYRMQAGVAYPMSDGFQWQDHPADINNFGQPKIFSTNGPIANFHDWVDQEHPHSYGIFDYYFLSGDETMREAAVEGMKNWFIGTNFYQGGLADGMWSTRAIGALLQGSARFGTFLNAIGDSAGSAAVFTQGQSTFNHQVKTQLCASGTPAGCNNGAANGGPWLTQGVSRTRGMHMTNAESVGNWCANPGTYRRASAFEAGILVQGMVEFRAAMGPGWADFWNSLDLAYGVSRWGLSEMFVDDGAGRWTGNGFRYAIAPDVSCSNPNDENFMPQAQQTVSGLFLVKNMVDGDTAWANKFKINLQADMSALGLATSDLGSYQIAAVINAINNPGPILTDVPVSSVVDNGGGKYTISWTVPAGAQSYRIKWDAKRIVDWIGFDPAKNVFIGDPANTTAWFAAANAANIPAPAAAGTTQTFTITTGAAGLTAQNFSVRAYISGAPVAPRVGANLLVVSGNNQTGQPGKALTSPFTVKVTDSNGNPVASVAVTFTVTSGGGTVSATSIPTDSQGLASSTLTLGPAAGANTVTAASAGLSGSPVTFSATAVQQAAPANLVLISGNSQTGTVGQALASAFTVKVTDAGGNPVSGVSVKFTVTAGGGALSAATVSTDASGVASSTLTLGPNSGANTVTATSGALAGSPITFTATGKVAAPAGSTISWSKAASSAGIPNNNGWFVTPYDPISQQTIVYGTLPTGSGIYSTDLFFYNSGTNAWTHLGGTGNTTSICSADTASTPGDRHPVGQMTIDTRRNVLWLSGGVCNGANRLDTYYLELHQNPLNDVWHAVTTAHNPIATTFSSMVYDPDDDVIFSFGYDISAGTHDNWVFCRTAENPTPGKVTAAQAAAGCSVGDDWNEVTVSGGVHPAGDTFAGLLYDTVTKKVIKFGGGSNQTWTYDVPTKKWTQKALATAAPPVDQSAYWNMPAWAYNSSTNKILYHQTGGAGAPADWEYDPVADTWTQVGSGTGPVGPIPLAYDAAHNLVIGFNGGLWEGTPSAGRTAGAPASLALVSGNGQSGQPGEALASALTVRVADASGTGVPGVAVSFAVTAGGGSLSAATVTTNSFGMASTMLTLGPGAGVNAVTATSGSLAGSPVTFTATATAAIVKLTAANLVLVGGNGQTGNAGQALPTPLTVKVTDSTGTGVAGVPVVFAVTAGGGFLSTATVTTDSSGLASTTLTLGSAGATNIVTATSGTLSGSPVTFTETAIISSAPAPAPVAALTWSKSPTASGAPRNPGWIVTPYDPVSHQIIVYGTLPTSSSTLSTDLYFYSSGANTWTHVGGTGSLGTVCTADTSALPGDRRPLGQMAIDTKRNFMWMSGGSCTGNSVPDTYYLQLNSDPRTDTWHKVTTAHNPNQTVYSSMVYDPDDDLIFSFGYDMGAATHQNWVFCRTAENPLPGVLTSKQLGAGCSAPDDWREVSVAGGVNPPGNAFPGLLYDTVTKKVILFGGGSNQTWAYDVPTKTWTRKALSTTVPPIGGLYWNMPAWAYNTATHKISYHQTNGAGAPADWQYDPAADTWSKLASVGNGSVAPQVLAYDASRNVLVGYDGGIWQGALPSPCDLNHDGVVNATDVQIAVSQALGQTACTSADLDGNGTCTVVDVQRVINASTGGGCRVGN